MIIGYFTYFNNFQNPPKQFWDENYHIASAQKYLDGTMYMEPHPPLGKLLIAFGEYLVDPNENLNIKHFNQTDYIKKFPKNYSFEGVRLFPALFALFNGLLFFFILYFIIKNRFLAFLFSSLYLFDNAMIVHSRAAMLESIQMFFILASVLYFLYMVLNGKLKLSNYLILSLLIGLNVSVKLNGLIMVLLFVYLFITEYKESFLKVLGKISAGFGMIVIVFILIMYIHVSLGKNIPTHKTYNASKEYKAIIHNNATSNIANFYIMLQDNIRYMANYSKGVPRYNPCKKNGENGSLAYTWPFGNKAISYRWEKDNDKVKYLYLISNPLIWFLGILSVGLSTILIGSKYIYSLNVKSSDTFKLILFFTFCYFSYMFVMVKIDRVMYLYHYFIPLVFSLILSALVFSYMFEEYIKKSDKTLFISVFIIAAAVFITYYHFSPLTYYEGIDYNSFLQRIWFEHWQLKAIR